MTTRVDIIGSVGVPASYGGFETLVENLVTQWEDEDVELRVYCSAPQFEKRPPAFRGARLIYLPLEANGISSIPYDMLSVVRSCLSRADTLLILGVSGAPSILLARLFGKRVITNIDGLEWKRDKWGRLARAVLKSFERIACRLSHAIVADNDVIARHVAETYGKTAHVIAYGADHSAPDAAPDPDLMPDLPPRYAVKVCRIEPENNVHLILDAFAERTGLPLVMVGNWKSSAYGRELKSRYADHADIHLLDPIYHLPTIGAIRARAALYVHGHSAGGTNPSLVEAMFLGLPVMAFACGYNEATTHDQAIYFADKTELLAQLDRIDATELAENGRRMKTLADRHYRWSHIADAYRSLVSR